MLEDLRPRIIIPLLINSISICVTNPVDNPVKNLTPPNVSPVYTNLTNDAAIIFHNTRYRASYTDQTHYHVRSYRGSQLRRQRWNLESPQVWPQLRETVGWSSPRECWSSTPLKSSLLRSQVQKAEKPRKNRNNRNHNLKEDSSRIIRHRRKFILVTIINIIKINVSVVSIAKAWSSLINPSIITSYVCHPLCHPTLWRHSLSSKQLEPRLRPAKVSRGNTILPKRVTKNAPIASSVWCKTFLVYNILFES